MLTALSISGFLAALRRSEPTPGGGSAAALAGAAGASLVAMVAGLPKPRASTPDDLRRLAESGARCTALANRLESLIDRDSQAYDAVVAAYRLAKGTDEEKRARAERIQEALRAAIDAPLDVMRACAEAMVEAGAAAALGNVNASSDVTVAVEMLRAGLRGAKANVEINLGSVKDLEYVRMVTEEMARLESGLDAALRASRG